MLFEKGERERKRRNAREGDMRRTRAVGACPSLDLLAIQPQLRRRKLRMLYFVPASHSGR